MCAEYIRFETSMGNFTVELYTQHAPKTCQNFKELANMGYYNDTIFHRVIKGMDTFFTLFWQIIELTIQQISWFKEEIPPELAVSMLLIDCTFYWLYLCKLGGGESIYG